MRRFSSGLAIGLVIWMPFCAAFAAAPEEDTGFQENTLTGDWGGMRNAAASNGFLFEGALKVDSLRSRGAYRDGTRTVSHLDLKLTMDLDQAWG